MLIQARSWQFTILNLDYPMRNLLLILLLASIGCTTTKRSSDENFDWLIGSWERTNEERGKSTFEKWTKVEPTEYRGISYTLKEGDTIWQENVRLRKNRDHWEYEVTQKGEAGSTPFKLTTIGKENFVCENDLNEFPKKITYSRHAERIHATISGGGTEIPFEFKRVE